MSPCIWSFWWENVSYALAEPPWLIQSSLLAKVWDSGLGGTLWFSHSVTLLPIDWQISTESVFYVCVSLPNPSMRWGSCAKTGSCSSSLCRPRQMPKLETNGTKLLHAQTSESPATVVQAILCASKPAGFLVLNSICLLLFQSDSSSGGLL